MGRSSRLNGALYVLAVFAACNLAVSAVRLLATERHVTVARLAVEAAVALCALWLAHHRRAGTQLPLVRVVPARARAEGDAPALDGRWTVWLRRLKIIVIPLLLALAAISVAGQWDTVSDGVSRLAHLHWRWVRYAIYAEALSIVCYAWLARALLHDDGQRISLGRLIAISLAGNAMANTVPGGPAWAAAFCFGQFRRHGINRRRASAVLVVVVLASAISLIGLVTVGVLLAGGRGPAADLRWLAIVVLVLLAAAAVVTRRPAVRAACVRFGGRCVARLPRVVRARTGELTVPALPRRTLAEALSASLGNWLADCGCLVLAILAVGGHVPWSGLLVVYGGTQLAVNLPVTPGGIGVVEGTLSLLLVGYGMHAPTAVAAVLLYRILSFWVLVPLGWAAAGALVWQGRRERTITPVGPVVPVAEAAQAVAPVAPAPQPGIAA